VYHKLLSIGCYHYISCCSLLPGSAVAEKIEKRNMEPGWSVDTCSFSSAVASLISNEWVGRVTVLRSNPPYSFTKVELQVCQDLMQAWHPVCEIVPSHQNGGRCSTPKIFNNLGMMQKWHSEEASMGKKGRTQ
jgi:hypothetical protein